MKEFFLMGGHGIYVWPAYGLTFTLLSLQWHASWKKWKAQKNISLQAKNDSHE